MSYKDNITLSVYWPPTKDYVNDEQYKYLADAGINYILGAGEETLHTPEIQKKMLSLCHKYGMGMTLHDGSFGPELLGKSAGEIASSVNKYKDIPACDGFYLQDEPFNPNIYTDAAKAIKKAYPKAILHLNFLPCFSYDSETRYANQMNDWCAVCRGNGFSVDYLTYDLYPFGFGEGNMNREGFIKNLNICRSVGAYNGVKTGIYLQSVSLLNGYPVPTEAAMRYEINLSLAYGMKWLSYFTWFTPINRGVEQFCDGIMTDKGEPSPLYETVKRLNSSVLAVGKTLINCKTVDVFSNGGKYGEKPIPADFFVKAIDSSDYMISYMRNPKTKQNYVMIVNNDFVSAQSVSVKFDGSVPELKLIDPNSGELRRVQSSVGVVKIKLPAGGAAIFALPDGIDYYKPKPQNKTANLCVDAKISCTNSLGENGYFISALNDGRRKPAKNINGWRTYTGKKSADITVDLGKVKAFNRIDIYRYSSPEFPSEIKVYGSVNGREYTKITEEKNVDVKDITAHSIKFDAVKMRYIKLSVSNSALGSIALCEIEVFNDTGYVSPPPKKTELYGAQIVAKYAEGDNIALGKPVFASSFIPDAYRQWGWATEFVNDGHEDTGYSSNIKIHKRPEAAEFVLVDLSDTFYIEKIVLKSLGCFPKDYKIQISDDCREWYDIAEEFDTESENGKRFEFDAYETEGRYVRLFATELAKSENDGYILQVGEIEVYGRPVCDKTELSCTLDEYRRAGGELENSVYLYALTAENNEYLTQSEADSYVEILKSLYDFKDAAVQTETQVFTPNVIEGKKALAKPQKKTVIAAVAGAMVTAMAVATVVLVKNKNGKSGGIGIKNNKKKK